MTRKIAVQFLASQVAPDSLQGALVVVVDVLRASSTIIQAFEAGAVRVIPCQEITEAQRLANLLEKKILKEGEDPTTETILGTGILLGGERGGLRIPGFQLDNSPSSYQREIVSGKTVIITTTNGTKALGIASQAQMIAVGAFTNLSALVRLIELVHYDLHILCAGTDGKISQEDVLFAGTLVSELKEDPDNENRVDKKNPNWELDDAAEIAICFASAVGPDRLEAMRKSLGGRNLLELGFDSDVEWCSVADRSDIVPILERTQFGSTVADQDSGFSLIPQVNSN